MTEKFETTKAPRHGVYFSWCLGVLVVFFEPRSARRYSVALVVIPRFVRGIHGTVAWADAWITRMKRVMTGRRLLHEGAELFLTISLLAV